MFEISSSSVMPTFPTATPKQSTFFNWNLIVDLTSVIFALRSSLWEMGVGNLPADEILVRLDGMDRMSVGAYLWKDQGLRDEESS